MDWILCAGTREIRSKKIICRVRGHYYGYSKMVGKLPLLLGMVVTIS